MRFILGKMQTVVNVMLCWYRSVAKAFYRASYASASWES